MPARRWGFAVPIAVALLALVAGAGVLTADSNRDRTISFYGVNTKETLTIQYMKNGKHIPEAMEKINWMLRDWRKDEPTQMDPDLIDLLRLARRKPNHISILLHDGAIYAVTERQTGVLGQMPRLAVHRNDNVGPDPFVHFDQLGPTGMPGNVNVGLLLGDNSDA